MTLTPSKEADSLESKIAERLGRFSNIYVLNASDFQSDVQAGNMGGVYVGQKSDSSINVLKSSQYTIAIKAYTCPDCREISVKIGNEGYKTFPTFNNKSEYNWIGFNTNLTEGKNPINIIVDGNSRFIDSMIVFTAKKSNIDINKSLQDLLIDPQLPEFSSPPKITTSKEIDPTKIKVEVNATRPFILKLLKPYESLWTAQFGEVKYDPVSVFPSQNGFVIDQVGYLRLSVEYKSQLWFKLGMTITIVIVIMIIAYSITRWKRDNFATNTK